jgi:hypothetical protein
MDKALVMQVAVSVPVDQGDTTGQKGSELETLKASPDWSMAVVWLCYSVTSASTMIR